MGWRGVWEQRGLHLSAQISSSVLHRMCMVSVLVSGCVFQDGGRSHVQRETHKGHTHSLSLLPMLPSLLLPSLLSLPPVSQVFACVVGQRPSKAKFYVNDTNEVVELLAKLAGVGLPPRNVSF